MQDAVGDEPVILSFPIDVIRPKKQVLLHFLTVEGQDGYSSSYDNDEDCYAHGLVLVTGGDTFRF
jgi:hypothetical protein